MKILPFIIPIVNSIYHTKIIYTPIAIPFLPYLHPVILFKKSEDNLLNDNLDNTNNIDNIDNINIIKNVYIIDYTPEEDLDFKNLIKILLGINTSGKIRLIYFENLNYNNIIEEWYNKTKKSDTNQVMKKLNDKEINNIINNFDKTFHLYKNNCINFKNYFLENIDSL